VATGTIVDAHRLAISTVPRMARCDAPVDKGAESVVPLCAVWTAIEPGGYYSRSTLGEVASPNVGPQGGNPLWKITPRLAGLQ
jgi:hypothetical protein